jgi:hypothetical protein
VLSVWGLDNNTNGILCVGVSRLGSVTKTALHTDTKQVNLKPAHADIDFVVAWRVAKFELTLPWRKQRSSSTLKVCNQPLKLPSGLRKEFQNVDEGKTQAFGI